MAYWCYKLRCPQITEYKIEIDACVIGITATVFVWSLHAFSG